MTGTGPHLPTSRRMWHLLEPVHAVVYFAPEVVDSARSLGLKGFWMGYFAGRAAPLGPVAPEVVTATFFNFHRRMVDRALPDAWAIASPLDVLAARLDGVGRVLRRVLGDDVVAGRDVARAAELAEQAVSHCSLPGRALFAAHASLPWPDGPHLRLWHAATLLREHRGDGHVAANLAHGFDGVSAHVAVTASGAVPRASLQPHRGWTDEEWDGAAARLADAGLLDSGRLTAEGEARRRAVEDATDRLAAGPWDHLGTERTDQLADLLRPLVAAVTSSGLVPYPNPMGLPRP
jgi:hypothetical protein